MQGIFPSFQRFNSKVKTIAGRSWRKVSILLKKKGERLVKNKSAIAISDGVLLK